MHFAEREERGNGPDGAHEHVLLRIPDIPLCREERCRIRARGLGHPPFDQFIEQPYLPCPRTADSGKKQSLNINFRSLSISRETTDNARVVHSPNSPATLPVASGLQAGFESLR